MGRSFAGSLSPCQQGVRTTRWRSQLRRTGLLTRFLGLDHACELGIHGWRRRANGSGDPFYFRPLASRSQLRRTGSGKTLSESFFFCEFSCLFVARPSAIWLRLRRVRPFCGHTSGCFRWVAAPRCAATPHPSASIRAIRGKIFRSDHLRLV